MLQKHNGGGLEWKCLYHRNVVAAVADGESGAVEARHAQQTHCSRGLRQPGGAYMLKLLQKQSRFKLLQKNTGGALGAGCSAHRTR